MVAELSVEPADPIECVALPGLVVEVAGTCRGRGERG